MKAWRSALALAYFIVSNNLLLCFVLGQYAPEDSYNQIAPVPLEAPANPYPDYYPPYPQHQVQGSPNGIDRQDIASLLASPGAGAIQFGALIILGGAAIITGVQAANTDRDLNTLRGRFITVCNAVRAAGAVDGETAPPMPDPAAQEALRRVNAVIAALEQVGSTTCNF